MTLQKNIRKAQKIIAKNNYMVLATANKKGMPWNVPVYFAYDKNYSFYWYSRKNTKHSRLIKENNTVAVTIFNSNPADEDEGGVYMTGQAFEIPEKELANALDVYCSR